MTAIAGVEHKGNVWIGGDSALTDVYSDGIRIQQSTAPKVWVCGEFLFGDCGSVRQGQLIKHVFQPPQIPDDVENDDPSMERYLTDEFLHALRGVLEVGGSLHSKNGVETGFGCLLIGVRGMLWRLEEDWGFYRSTLGYHAVGCGTDFALGSLHATQTTKMRPEQRVRAALEAASQWSGAVSPPYTILCTDGEEYVCSE